MNNGAPFYYDYANIIDAFHSPSEIHCSDSRIVQYYGRYLLQKAMSPFKWVLPDSWASNYFLYSVYCGGFAAVVNTDKFGVIPQACGLQGYTVFYQPSHAVINNPLLRGTLRPRIGVDCTLIRLQPDYNGIGDIVQYHANLMGLAYEALAGNLLNSKLAFVAYADNKAVAETLKKLYDQVARGVPAVVQHKRSLVDDSPPPFQLFNQELSKNFIAPDLLAAIRTIERHFDNMVGIPVNMVEGKKERAVAGEIDANNFESRSRQAIWLEELQKSCEETRDMFGIEISVNWRDGVGGSDFINTGTNGVGLYQNLGGVPGSRRNGQTAGN